MNAIAKVERQQLLPAMAEKYQLQPEEFARTVRATCGMPSATPEQFAAFLIVAKTYNLNPILREIWAFPGRGGGIVPIVSIDGWANIVNSHPVCDGFEFEMIADGDDIGCTCKIYRKDRSHPVAVTEWMSECIRDTPVWKGMKKRMLRHKAFIQAARLAFGLAGIYDEEEGQAIANAPARDVTPVRVPSPSEVEQIAQPAESEPDIVLPADPISSGPPPAPPAPEPPKSKLKWPELRKDYEKWITLAFKRINEHMDPGELETFFLQEINPTLDKLLPPDKDDVIAAYDRRQLALKDDGDAG